MLKAILTRYELNNIKNKATVYFDNNYILTIPTDNIPNEDKLIPIIIDTKIRIPVHYTMHTVPDSEFLIDPIYNRDLMAYRSRLDYVISELLSQKGFYFKLHDIKNNENTQRLYVYEMYYNEILCYTYDNKFLSYLTDRMFNLSYGPILVSTYWLYREDVPDWFIFNHFKDFIDMKELDMSDKILVNGKKELYIFYKEPLNVLQEYIDDFMTNLRTLLYNCIQLKIFPRDTSHEFILSHRLTQMADGRWTLSFGIPIGLQIPFYNDEFRTSIEYENVKQLFDFLVHIYNFPTAAFILKELDIYVYENMIKINYDTKYLPDFIRIKKIELQNLTGNVNIYYFDKLLKPLNLENKSFIKFYDKYNNQDAILVSDTKIEQLEYYIPESFSIEDRVKIDNI